MEIKHGQYVTIDRSDEIPLVSIFYPKTDSGDFLYRIMKEAIEVIKEEGKVNLFSDLSALPVNFLLVREFRMFAMRITPYLDKSAVILPKSEAPNRVVEMMAESIELANQREIKIVTSKEEALAYLYG